jgi:glycosyltransferase involved in cell wall biosynthesis
MSVCPVVAVLFEYPTLNGGERSLLASIGRLRGRFQFVGYAPAGGPLRGALADAGVEVRPSPLVDAAGQRMQRAGALDGLVEAVRSSGANLLHGNSLATGRLTGAAAARLGVPVTAHLRDIVGLSAAAVADLNGNARLVAVSEAARAFHVGQGVDPAKAVTAYNGVDLDRFRPRPRCARVREEFGIPPDALVVLTVGQIGLRKGWDVLAEAAAALAGRFPSLHVLLAGERYSEKSETVAYERAVRGRFAEVMPGRAHFLGYRGDIADVMNAADLLVHPARQEPFGRVLLEAAASGLPVVATVVGGTAELLEDGMSARLVPAGDAGALARAVGELLADAGLQASLAAAARRRVEVDFSAERAAERLAAVWNDVLSEARA